MGINVHLHVAKRTVKRRMGWAWLVKVLYEALHFLECGRLAGTAHPTRGGMMRAKSF